MKSDLSILALALVVACNGFGEAQAKTSKSTTRGITSQLQGSEMSSAEEKVDGKTYHIGKIIVSASPADVFAVLSDYPSATKLFTNLKKSKVVASNEANHTHDVSFSLKGMGGMWNFDYILRMKETAPSLIEFHRLSGAFKANEGYWKIEPLDTLGKKTLVTYAKHVDGGLLPQSMVTKQVKEAMPTVMANVKTNAESRAVQVSLR